MRKFDVEIHFKGWGWDTYSAESEIEDDAFLRAIKRVAEEEGNAMISMIDAVRIFCNGRLCREFEV